MEAIYIILLPILFSIESVNGTILKGHDHEIGPYHTTMIYVDDANRIAKLNGLDIRWSYTDRNDKVKSEQMIKTVCNHYNKGVLQMDITMVEMLVRIGCTHNVGGSVNSKRDTVKYKKYARKIRKRYSKRSKSK